MNRDQIARMINDRFTRWTKQLEAERATPLLAVGLTERGSRLVLCACEGLDDAHIDRLLGAARLLLVSQRSKDKGEH
jgi:hypothetical protein